MQLLTKVRQQRLNRLSLHTPEGANVDVQL